MAQTVPPPITGSPAPPQRGDRTTFSVRVDAFITWLASAVAEFGAVATNTYGNAIDAYNSSVAAASSAGAAATSESSAGSFAAAASASAGAPMWVSGTTYTLGSAVWSPTTRLVYRRIVAGAGTTDPSADAVNWAIVGAVGLAVVAVAGITQTAVAGVHYVLTNVGTSTLTLPSSPASGATVAVTPANARVTNVIASNGQTIMGLAEDMTLDSADATVALRFINSTWRLI